jgi:hypothetical protein
VGGAGSTDETSSLEVDGTSEGIGASLEEPAYVSGPACVARKKVNIKVSEERSRSRWN